jgi:hypothetical protein
MSASYCFLFGLRSYTEEGGGMFLRNVSWFSNGLHGIISQMFKRKAFKPVRHLKTLPSPIPLDGFIHEAAYMGCNNSPFTPALPYSITTGKDVLLDITTRVNPYIMRHNNLFSFVRKLWARTSHRIGINFRSSFFLTRFQTKKNRKQLVPVCVTADKCSPPIYGWKYYICGSVKVISTPAQ